MLIRYESTAGLTTVGIRILNADKTEYAALTTAGVTEVSPGGYGVTVADSVLAGRTVEWYEGATYSVAESFPSVVADAASIKAKTDALPTDPADQSAVEDAITSAISPIAASVASVVSILQDILRTALNRRTVTATQQILYEDDGVTPRYTQTLSDDGTTAERGAAT